MRKKSEILLPKTAGEVLNGGVYRQSIRCGKRTCKCMEPSGEHVAFYFIFRRNGRQFKKYIPRNEVDSVKQVVETARQKQKSFRMARHQATIELRAIKDYLVSIKNDHFIQQIVQKD